MHPIPKGFMLEAITQKVDSSAVAHPNGTKVAGTFVDRPGTHERLGAHGVEGFSTDIVDGWTVSGHREGSITATAADGRYVAGW